jgi:hypothetical protein
MSDFAFIALSREEREILQEALAAYRNRSAMCNEVAALAKKLRRSSYPKITIGVKGGLVEWTSGNPFPIRICDYDFEGSYPKYVDERGNRCVISFEPSDDSDKFSRYRTP